MFQFPTINKKHFFVCISFQISNIRFKEWDKNFDYNSATTIEDCRFELNSSHIKKDRQFTACQYFFVFLFLGEGEGGVIGVYTMYRPHRQGQITHKTWSITLHSSQIYGFRLSTHDMVAATYIIINNILNGTRRNHLGKVT